MGEETMNRFRFIDRTLKYFRVWIYSDQYFPCNEYSARYTIYMPIYREWMRSILLVSYPSGRNGMRMLSNHRKHIISTIWPHNHSRILCCFVSLVQCHMSYRAMWLTLLREQVYTKPLISFILNLPIRPKRFEYLHLQNRSHRAYEKIKFTY